MAVVTKQLGQLRPADANAASIYSPGAGVATRITSMVVCNQSGNARKFRIFLDDDGAAVTTAEALFYDEAIAANTTRLLTGLGWFMDDSSGNLSVRTDAANELTFTVFGMELS